MFIVAFLEDLDDRATVLLVSVYTGITDGVPGCLCCASGGCIVAERGNQEGVLYLPESFCI